jgi:hypothetical protein
MDELQEETERIPVCTDEASVFPLCDVTFDERAYTRTEVGVGRKDGKYKD